MLEFLSNLFGKTNFTIIYDDTNQQAQVLYSSHYQLTGKPDYILSHPKLGLLPVEIKSNRIAHAPETGHVLQIATYCLLIEEIYQQPVRFGVLQYRNQSFKIDWTSELKKSLLKTIKQMRQSYQEQAACPADNPNKCAQCKYLSTCPQWQN